MLGGVGLTMPERIETTGWSMFPTVEPGETLRVEPVRPSAVTPGDVVAVFGKETRYDGEGDATGRDVTDRTIVMTHRVVATDDETVTTTGDLDPTAEWERDPLESVVGRVVGVERDDDASDDRDLRRLCWYWETFARTVCNCRAETYRERVVGASAGLLDAALARLGGDDASVFEVTPVEADDDAEALATRYRRVTAVLNRRTDWRPHSPGVTEQTCWHRPDEVRFVSLPRDASRERVARFVRRSRRHAATVLPVPSGPMVYPTVVGTVAFTPCLDCSADEPACRRRTTPTANGKFINRRVELKTRTRSNHERIRRRTR